MPSLPNYLESHRRRQSLSQEDVAFLVGMAGPGQICRFERFARVPSLEMAFAFEVVFQKPVREIFAGLFQEMEEQVRARTLALVQKIEGADQIDERKLQALKAIISFIDFKTDDNGFAE